jgi:hypothetical protein
MPRSVAKACLALTGLFEAELLTELMLRHWNHPLADDADFRSALLESAAQALRLSIRGQRLFESLDPQNVNLVAALCYAESVTLEQRGGIPQKEYAARQRWLKQVSRAIPSCFCNPDELV